MGKENSQSPPENYQKRPGNSENDLQIRSKIEPERAPAMMQNNKESLPNGRQQEPPRGRREAPSPREQRRSRRLVVFHLVRISYVFAAFPEPVLAGFLAEFADSKSFPSNSDSFPADSENSQGASKKGLFPGPKKCTFETSRGSGRAATAGRRPEQASRCASGGDSSGSRRGPSEKASRGRSR